MWEHLARHGSRSATTARASSSRAWARTTDEHRTGAREVVNIPMSKVLYDNTCRDFPIFNMNIPDQYRAVLVQQGLSRKHCS